MDLNLEVELMTTATSWHMQGDVWKCVAAIQFAHVTTVGIRVIYRVRQFCVCE